MSTMEDFIMPYGKFQGLKINSSRISKEYLEKLEEDLLIKGINTSTPLMVAIDKELKRRNGLKKKPTKLNVQHPTVVSCDH